LKKYEGEDIQADNDIQLEELDKNSNKIRICVIDLETTGLSHDDDEVIGTGGTEFVNFLTRTKSETSGSLIP